MRSRVFAGTLIVGTIVLAILVLRNRGANETAPDPSDLTHSAGPLWPPTVVEDESTTPSFAPSVGEQVAGELSSGNQPASFETETSRGPADLSPADATMVDSAALPAKFEPAGGAGYAPGHGWEHGPAEDPRTATRDDAMRTAHRPTERAAGHPEHSAPQLKTQPPTRIEPYTPMQLRPRLELSPQTNAHPQSNPAGGPAGGPDTYIRPPQPAQQPPPHNPTNQYPYGGSYHR